MVTHRRAMLFLLLLPLAMVAACDKVPLLAPTGTVITLIPATTTVPLNGEVTIVATVIENGVAAAGSGSTTGTTSTSRSGNGTPVQNGTVVTFTTTIGRIEPSEARTHNGEVTVKLITGSTSGTATITAYSGGASAQITNLKVGTASVKTVTLTSTPQSLGSSGGSVAVQATVSDEGGAPLAGIPVTFSTDKGSVSPSTVNTDANGVATATLTTTATAKVTATVGATSGTATVTVSPTALSGFKSDTSSPTAGTAVQFTITPNTNANLQNVHVDFGDGRSTDLGPISAATTTINAYCSPGAYTARATATDSGGGSGSLSTNVIVAALPVTLSNTGATVDTSIKFTAAGVAAAQVSRFNWNWDDGTASYDTSGPETFHTFSTRGQKTVRVDVYGVGCGKIGTATLVMNIS